MPVEVTESDGRVAEVRLLCDQCDTLIGIRVVLKTQVKPMEKAGIICHQCKEIKVRAKRIGNTR